MRGTLVYILGIYQMDTPMPTRRSPNIAKIFMHGRSQAVRLPKEFRLPGKEVRVSRAGAKIVLEPIRPPAFDVKAWRAELEALGAKDFLPEGRPAQPPMPPGPNFDE
jgi:antitoxin VapB